MSWSWVAFLKLSLAVSSESLAVALLLTDLWLFSTSRSCRKKLAVGPGRGNGCLRLRMVRSRGQGLCHSVLGNYLKSPVISPHHWQGSLRLRFAEHLREHLARGPPILSVNGFLYLGRSSVRLRKWDGDRELAEADEITSRRRMEEARRTGLRDSWVYPLPWVGGRMGAGRAEESSGKSADIERGLKDLLGHGAQAICSMCSKITTLFSLLFIALVFMCRN